VAEKHQSFLSQSRCRIEEVARDDPFGLCTQMRQSRYKLAPGTEARWCRYREHEVRIFHVSAGWAAYPWLSVPAFSQIRTALGQER
jgi:hypothetical protein